LFGEEPARKHPRMDREIASLAEIRARYAGDEAAVALIDQCIELYRRAASVADADSAERLQQQVDRLLLRLTAGRWGEP
jgi:hypothetical protein